MWRKDRGQRGIMKPEGEMATARRIVSSSAESSMQPLHGLALPALLPALLN
jgi:hypothetical protein